MLSYEDGFNSSAIDAIAYDGATRELFVFFKSGDRAWCYETVPSNVYAAFVAASSHGRYFRAHVRDRFTARQLSPQEIAAVKQRAALPGGALQIRWIEALAGAPATRDTLGLFF